MRTVNVTIKNLKEGDVLYVGTRDWISEILDRLDYQDEVLAKKITTEEEVTVKIERGKEVCVHVWNQDYVWFGWNGLADGSIILKMTRVKDRCYGSP